jgi:hypothetical protein
MSEAAPPVLAAWQSFYAMAGTSAAALIGLMFVVISLVQGRETARSRDGIATFSTPTVLHFGAALLVSAVLVAPWHSLVLAGVVVAVVGCYGVAYIVRVMVRTRRLTNYIADAEDWTYYTILPFVAYGVIFAGAIALMAVPAKALFAIAAGVVLLLFIGIRNAWDVVTFLAAGGPGSG